jgi:hypothetical protein
LGFIRIIVLGRFEFNSNTIIFIKSKKDSYLMDIKISSLSREFWGHTRFPIKKLKREAVRNKVNPALSDRDVSVEISRRWKGAKLDFNYKTPIDALEAYRHAVAYEVITREIQEVRSWYHPVITVETPELKLGEGAWTIFPAEKKHRVDKISVSVGVYGDIGRDLGDSFESVFRGAVGDPRAESLKYKGRQVVGDSPIFLNSYFDRLTPEDFLKKIEDAKRWIKPCFKLEHIPDLSETPEGLIRITNEIFLSEELSEEILIARAEIPLGKFGSKEMIAEYSWSPKQ